MALDIDKLIENLNNFDPDEATDKVIDTSNELLIAENDLKVARAVVFIREKNAEGKPTDKLVEAKVESDENVKLKTNEVIRTEGNYLSAKLKREDLYEKYQRDKKIADLNKVSF
jgi:hypothetical protein